MEEKIRKYKIVSKPYYISGSDISIYLDMSSIMAVKVRDINGNDCILVSDGFYCYIESSPWKYYELEKPVPWDKMVWKFKHKHLGIFELSL